MERRRQQQQSLVLILLQSCIALVTLTTILKVPGTTKNGLLNIRLTILKSISNTLQCRGLLRLKYSWISMSDGMTLHASLQQPHCFKGLGYSHA